MATVQQFYLTAYEQAIALVENETTSLKIVARAAFRPHCAILFGNSRPKHHTTKSDKKGDDHDNLASARHPPNVRNNQNQ